MAALKTGLPDPGAPPVEAMLRILDGARTPAQVNQAATADVRRAARFISTGLDSCPALTPPQQEGGGQPAWSCHPRRLPIAHSPTPVETRATVRRRHGPFPPLSSCRALRRPAAARSRYPPQPPRRRSPESTVPTRATAA
jgi:hypothetical protein